MQINSYEYKLHSLECLGLVLDMDAFLIKPFFNKAFLNKA